MIYYEHSGVNPYFNLALEEILLHRADVEPVLLLWQNEPTIVLGRYQNTFGELNLEFVRERDLHVVRRLTGGGAVYHDLGNLNYSILSPSRQGSCEIDFTQFIQPVCTVLKSAGLPVESSGRNDLIVNGRKISGSAQMRVRGRVLHHGTLLFDVRLDDMACALRVAPDKFQSKAVASVRSRVTNIKESLPPGSPLRTVADFKRLLQTKLTGFGAIQARSLDPALFAAAEKLAGAKYATWSWNFGQSPASDFHFAKRFSWGKIELYLHVVHGLIAGGEVRGDFFAAGDPNDVITRLTGQVPDDHLIDAVLETPEIQAIFAIRS
ncbi:MAG: lipoate--protein ligase [Planctomycetia bacterium]|nr:lipoate--protein ligase [Planctomycetia bacterium]